MPRERDVWVQRFRDEIRPIFARYVAQGVDVGELASAAGDLGEELSPSVDDGPSDIVSGDLDNQ